MILHGETNDHVLSIKLLLPCLPRSTFRINLSTWISLAKLLKQLK